MFDRRKLLITLCMLACILLAGGFLSVNFLGWAALPLLSSLYTEGWWTLLLILPSLTMFALDGYSRPALGLLASGLLLFANTHGLIAPGMLAAAVVNTVIAAAAGGAALEITAKSIAKRKNAPQLEDKRKKALEEKASSKSPFAAEENTSQAPAASPRQAKPQSSSWSSQPSQASQTQAASSRPQPAKPSQTVPPNPYKSTPSQPPQSGNIYSRPASSIWKDKAEKGWDPSRSYRNPKDRRISSSTSLPQVQTGSKNLTKRSSPYLTAQKSRQRSFATSSNYPQCIAFFSSSKASSNHQALNGGLAISIFGDAKLTLRDADYNNPITLSMLSLFGSSKVEVPYVSNISIQPISLFGACKDNRKLVNSSAMPTITIRCISLFGDCRIM